MNNGIVMFLSSVKMVTKLVEHRLGLDRSLTYVLLISTPSKKVTILNVPPFMSDDMTFWRKYCLNMENWCDRSKWFRSDVNLLLKHIVSFRWFVYMTVKDDADLDLTLNIWVDDLWIMLSSSPLEMFQLREKRTPSSRLSQQEQW